MSASLDDLHSEGMGNILVYWPSDGFTWVSRPTPLEDAELPPHKFSTLPVAIKAARDAGLDPTHWINPEGGKVAHPIPVVHDGSVKP